MHTKIAAENYSIKLHVEMFLHEKQFNYAAWLTAQADFFQGWQIKNKKTFPVDINTTI